MKQDNNLSKNQKPFPDALSNIFKLLKENKSVQYSDSKTFTYDNKSKKFIFDGKEVNDLNDLPPIYKTIAKRLGMDKNSNNIPDFIENNNNNNPTTFSDKTYINVRPTSDNTNPNKEEFLKSNSIENKDGVFSKDKLEDKNHNKIPDIIENDNPFFNSNKNTPSDYKPNKVANPIEQLRTILIIIGLIALIIYFTTH